MRTYIYTYICVYKLLSLHTYQPILSMPAPFPSMSPAIMLAQTSLGATAVTCWHVP